VCEELQLLEVSVFGLPGEFSTNNHFTHTTSRECKPSLLLAIVQGRCFANGFSQFVANILFTDDAEFTRDGIVNFHSTHVWADDNPHTTVTSKHFP
jgi:hypothetical protein